MIPIAALALCGLAAASPVSPFACNPSALDPVERRSHFEVVGPELRRRVRGVRELPAGYAFEFAGDGATTRKLARWAAEEAACCPFFDIEVRIAREGGP